MRRNKRFHRDLVGVSDKLPVVEALAELHAGIFRRSVEEMRLSATYRARAIENLLLAYRHMVR